MLSCIWLFYDPITQKWKETIWSTQPEYQDNHTEWKKAPKQVQVIHLYKLPKIQAIYSARKQISGYLGMGVARRVMDMFIIMLVTVMVLPV